MAFSFNRHSQTGGGSSSGGSVSSIADVPGLAAALAAKEPKRRVFELYETGRRDLTDVNSVGAALGPLTFSGGARLLVTMYASVTASNRFTNAVAIGLEYSLDSGANWASIGHSGSINAHRNRTTGAGAYHNSFLLDPAQAGDFSILFRFTARASAAGGTGSIGGHGSGATFNSHLRIEEIAP